MLFVIVLLLVFLFWSLYYYSGGIVPYSHTMGDYFSQEYPYEGFGTMETEYSGVQKNEALDSYSSFFINPSSNGPKGCKKVEGFKGLFCEPYVAGDKIDILGDAQGKLTCNGEGSGLSNSKGSLCFNENQKKLLTTRGGNATGVPSQIG
jgi:hypothetical protein